MSFWFTVVQLNYSFKCLHGDTVYHYLINILKYITLQNQAAVMVGGVNYICCRSKWSSGYNGLNL